MVRPTIGNLVMVTLLSVVGIWALKALVNIVPIPGGDVVRSI